MYRNLYDLILKLFICLGEHVQTIDELQSDFANKTQIVDALNDRMEDLRSKVLVSESNEADLKNEKSILESRLSKAEKDSERNKSQVNVLEEELSEIKFKMTNNESKCFKY